MPSNEQLNIDIKGSTAKLVTELQKLRNELKQEGNELVKLTMAGKQTTQAFKDQENKVKSLGEQVKQLSRVQRGLTAESKRSIYQLLEAAENITTVLYGVGFAMSKIWEQGKDVIMTAADVETLGVVVHRLGENAGYTRGEIDKHVEAIRKMGITSMSAKQVVAKMIQSEMDLADATHIADIARNSAVIGLTNTSDAYERIINAISTGNPESLKMLGITMNLTQVYKDFAKEMDITGRELTVAEKKTAMLNEVFRQGDKWAGTYEEALETVGKKTRSFERYTEEAKVELGNYFLPVVNTAIDTMTSLTKAFIDSEKPVQVFAGGIFLVGSNITTLLPIVASLKIAFGSSFLAVMGAAGGAIVGIASAVYSTINTISQLISLIDKVVVKGEKLGWGDIGRTFAKTTVVGNVLYGDEEEVSKSLWGLDKSIWGVRTKLYNLTKNETKEREKQVGQLKEIDKIQKKTQTGRTGKGGESKEVEDKKEELNLLVLANQEYVKLQEKIQANLSNVGAMLELRKEELTILERMAFLETGINESKQFQMDLSQRIFELNKKMGYSPEQAKRLETQRGGSFGGRGIMGAEVSLLSMIPQLFQGMESSVQGINNIFTNLMSVLKLEADSFLAKLIGGFNTVISLIQTLLATINAINTVSSFIGLLTSFIPGGSLLAGRGRAEGGLVNAGVGYPVGERGVEWFVPNQTGNVLSNRDTMQLLAGMGTQTPIVNNYFSVESDFINVLEKNMPLYNQRKFAKR